MRQAEPLRQAEPVRQAEPARQQQEVPLVAPALPAVQPAPVASHEVPTLVRSSLASVFPSAAPATFSVPPPLPIASPSISSVEAAATAPPVAAPPVAVTRPKSAVPPPLPIEAPVAREPEAAEPIAAPPHEPEAVIASPQEVPNLSAGPELAATAAPGDGDAPTEPEARDQLEPPQDPEALGEHAALSELAARAELDSENRAEASSEHTATSESELAAERATDSESGLGASEPELDDAERAAASASELDAPGESDRHPSLEPNVAAATALEAHHRFTSTGSEMPVVVSAPAPRSNRHFDSSRWMELTKEWRPLAQGWSESALRTLRTSPRALVLSAPLIAVLGIWLAHSLVTHRPRRSPEALTRHLAHTTPALTSPASAFLAPPPAPAGSAVTTIAPPAAPEPTAATASSAELARANARGLPGLEALSAKYPGDTQAALVLAKQQVQAQRFDSAVATVERLLSVAPSNAQNGKVMGIFWRAAQSSASEQSFLALRKLGGPGSDIVLDLATTPGVRDSVRDRAKDELLSHPAFDASEDTRVASALLLARDCEARRALLGRAEREGGKRTRALLERMGQGTGCGANADGTCSPCLIGSSALSHALTVLSAGEKP